MTKIDDLKKKWMKNPGFKVEYEAMTEEFSLAHSLIGARVKANMTQEDVANAMNTSQSYIARLEGGRITPSIKALKRYARATGATLSINLVT